jgi:hypothetical protein
VGGDQARAQRKLGEVDDAGVQPLVVGFGRRELRLDLLVIDDAPLGRVDQSRTPTSLAMTTRPSSVTQ